MFNCQPKPTTNLAPAHRIAFRHQRAIFVFTVLGLIILFSTAVLWSHYETVIGRYQWLAKAGLALVDVIAIGLACWHLYARYAPLKVWCYLADAALAVVMVVHAGAVLQLDSSSAQQLTKVKAAAEAQGTIEAARIKAAAEAAAAIKQQTGSSALANRTLRTAQPAASDAALMKMAASVKPETFLSEEYLQGGVYYWPALVALFFFFIAIGISSFALPYEDANRNGIPDHLENFFRSPKIAPGFVGPAQCSIPRPRPYVSTADKQARIETKPDTAPFTAPPKGSVSESESTPKERSSQRSFKRSGGGYDLPDFPLLQWELNERGGWEAWHTPEGTQRRRDRTYLGYLGKRQLEAWRELAPVEFREAVEAWVEQKRAAKD